MNLDNLKPAWRQFRWLNSMQAMDHREILLMLERGEEMAAGKTYGLLVNALVFISLTLCCQGG